MSRATITPTVPVLHAGSLLAEYAKSDLGHGRRNQRLLRVVAQAARNPAASFPEMAGRELNRLYELLANPNVTAEAILSGHIAETLLRCQKAVRVFIAADTSECGYKRPARDWGR